MSRFLIDSNLLVLLVVGRVDRNLIGRHRRLKQFTPDDYDALVKLLDGADGMVVTPNTLTETSNLLAFQRGSIAEALAVELQALIEQEIEVVVPSVEAARRQEFRRLGLTDAALAGIASVDRRLLTTDMQLFGTAVATDAAAAVYFRTMQEDGR